MSISRDTAVGYGFVVTLSGHAKKDEDLWADPASEIEKILNDLPDCDAHESFYVATGTNAFEDDTSEEREEVAVMAKGEHRIGGYETHGLVAVNRLKTVTPLEEHRLHQGAKLITRKLGQKIKKINPELGWICVSSVC